jgi:hypothetical protein
MGICGGIVAVSGLIAGGIAIVKGCGEKPSYDAFRGSASLRLLSLGCRPRFRWPVLRKVRFSKNNHFGGVF